MRAPFLLILGAIVAFVLYLSIYIVDERQRVMVFRFGEIVKTVHEPGLNFKVPVIDTLERYDDRILSLDSEEFVVIPVDNRRLVVDAFTRWRIEDPRLFYQAVRTRGIPGGEALIARILDEALRNILGGVTSSQILSDERAQLMRDIGDRVSEDADSFGVEIVDVRIKRADLPPQNLQATYERMKAERQQEAEDERARGDEAAQRIVYSAQRQSTELISEARRQANVIQGEADAERNRIFAEAYSQDQEFFDFYRSLQAYRASLLAGNTSLVVSPDSSFFKYLQNENGLPEDRARAGASGQ